jgi:hypothetical protein
MSRRAEQGRFPEPVKIGEGKNGRIAYVEAEILEWVNARIAEREQQAPPAGEPEQPSTEPTAAPVRAERSAPQQRRQAAAPRKRASTGRRV